MGGGRGQVVQAPVAAVDLVVPVDLEVEAREILEGPGGAPRGFESEVRVPTASGQETIREARVVRGGPGGNNNAVGTALAELTTALADTTSTPEQIKAKLAAVRNARQKAAADLAAAQKALLPLLTADQEATLVSLGYLD